jgi:hypothetical protein
VQRECRLEERMLAFARESQRASGPMRVLAKENDGDCISDRKSKNQPSDGWFAFFLPTATCSAASTVAASLSSASRFSKVESPKLLHNLLPGICSIPFLPAYSFFRSSSSLSNLPTVPRMKDDVAKSSCKDYEMTSSADSSKS